MRKETIITRQYSITAKFAPYVFCPANAIEDEFYHREPGIVPELITNDGVAHKCQFLSTWNNRDGEFNEEFEDVCQQQFGMPFESIKSIWISRLGKLNDYWHLIKLD